MGAVVGSSEKFWASVTKSSPCLSRATSMSIFLRACSSFCALSFFRLRTFASGIGDTRICAKCTCGSGKLKLVLLEL